MTRADPIRPASKLPLRALACAGALLVAGGCSGVEDDPHRFERWAESVAEIPLSVEDARARAGQAVAAMGERPSEQAGLRPALHVVVVEPHELWEARDPVLRGAMDLAGRAAGQVVSEAARQGTRQIAEAVTGPAPASVSAPSRQTSVIQVGAYSSEAAARSAWQALSRRVDATYQPVFETVDVGGRSITRLKIGPVPAEAAAGLCAALGVSDPWCARARS
ncbi:MAG: SPOR domain-containing protein [Brevundimonas sp.]|jgi:hypothetical protein|uniref:SPOR domain-containing protein n=1 Tax=Brevundimonas sp. TaxID=1871086 RepID=UPI003918FB4D